MEQGLATETREQPIRCRLRAKEQKCSTFSLYNFETNNPFYFLDNHKQNPTRYQLIKKEIKYIYNPDLIPKMHYLKAI